MLLQFFSGKRTLITTAATLLAYVIIHDDSYESSVIIFSCTIHIQVTRVLLLLCESYLVIGLYYDGTHHVVYHIYPYRSFGIYFLLMIFDPAFK